MMQYLVWLLLGLGVLVSRSAAQPFDRDMFCFQESSGTWGYCEPGVPTRATTGTPVAVVTADKGGLVTFAHSSAITATIAAAGSTGFDALYNVYLFNTNGAGGASVTLTPTTSMVNGASTLVLTPGMWCLLVSGGTHYNALCAGAAVSQAPDMTVNLVGHWKFDENTGTTAADSGSGTHAGTLSGTTLPTWIPGHVGAALDFNGTTAAVTIADTPDLDVGTAQDFTLAAWVNIGTLSASGVVCAKYTTGAAPGYALYITSTGHAKAHLRDGVGTGTAEIVDVEGTTDLSNAGWSHVAATYTRSGNLVLYVNGVSEGTPESLATITETADNGTAFVIGARNNGSNERLDGGIDDVRFYARALSASDMTALFQQ